MRGGIIAFYNPKKMGANDNHANQYRFRSRKCSSRVENLCYGLAFFGFEMPNWHLNMAATLEKAITYVFAESPIRNPESCALIW
jgi:hypothetical protein